MVASDDARFGTPYSRVWGCHLTGMWIYRPGLAKAKYSALTGEWISGKEAAEIELINFSYPLEELDDRVAALASKLATIPLTASRGHTRRPLRRLQPGPRRGPTPQAQSTGLRRHHGVGLRVRGRLLPWQARWRMRSQVAPFQPHSSHLSVQPGSGVEPAKATPARGSSSRVWRNQAVM